MPAPAIPPASMSQSLLVALLLAQNGAVLKAVKAALPTSPDGLNRAIRGPTAIRSPSSLSRSPKEPAMRFRFAAAALLALLSSHAAAFDATKASRYPSPDMFRPNVDRLTINGPGSIGDASTLCVKAVGSPFCRTHGDRAKDVVNAADYFTCDGVTPVDAALQGVFNLAATLKSPVINLPAGVCITNATVNLNVAATVHGAGMSAGPGAVDHLRGTVLSANFKNGDVINATSLYGFTFRDFQINSNVGYRSSGAGLHVSGPSGGSGNGGTKIERIATNNQYVGIQCTACLLTEISGTYHQAWARTAYLADGTPANEASGGYLHHNWFEGNQAAGTTQFANIESHVGYIRISHNLFLGSQSAIALVFNIGGAGSSVITDNSLENCVGDCITIANGNGVTANNLQISRNEFMATGADVGAYINNFIHVISNSGGTGSYISNVQINENTMVGQFTNSGVATYMNIASGDNVSINDNTVQHMGGDTAYGIIIGAEATKVAIRNFRETGTSSHLKYLLGSNDVMIADRQGLPFAALPNAANGSCIYVPDGVTGSTFNAAVTGGGTGAFAGRLNGSWVNHC